MGSVPDLTRPIQFRGVELNTSTTALIGGKTVLIGCVVDTFDPTEVEIRQFTEPFALLNGLDVGGTWLGARRPVMTGTVYDVSRGATYDRLAALEAVMIAESGTFGIYPLTWYTITAGGPVQKTLQVRPGGLRYIIDRDTHSGRDTDSLSIRWSVAFLAKKPAIE